MASLPLMASQAAVNQLLSELLGNDLPEAASFWPPAPLYWLLLFFGFTVVGFIFWRWWHYRDLKRARKQLTELQNYVDAQKQLLQLHLLLRAAAVRWQAAPVNQSPDQFAELIKHTLNIIELPAWVNAHYSAQPTASIDWHQAQQLLQTWYKGARR